jgi:hypothetical protein
MHCETCSIARNLKRNLYQVFLKNNEITIYGINSDGRG